jgi:hypothetical protein
MTSKEVEARGGLQASALPKERWKVEDIKCMIYKDARAAVYFSAFVSVLALA